MILGHPQNSARFYDHVEMKLAKYTFDGVGNVLTVTDALGNITTNQFDEIYRRIAVEDDLGNWTMFTFDDANNLLTVRDAENKITTNSYNELNRQISTTDAIGAVVTKSYDANGNLSSITDDNGNTTSYEFDELNRLVTTTYADSGTVVSTYDSNSNVLTTTDQNGTVVTNTYDNLNRLTARTINRGTGVIGTTLQTFVYDKIGKMVEAFDNNDPNTTVDDATILYSFDTINRVITETLEIGPAGNPDYTYTNMSIYDEISRTSLIYPSPKLVEYTYTDLNQIDTISSDSMTIVDYGYNAVGLVTAKAFANGVVSTSTFNDIYRETQRDVVYNGTTDIIKMHYYHDNVGNRLFEKREWTGYSKGDYHTYDDIYRLTGSKYEVPGTELDAFETYGTIPTTYVKYQDFTMDDVGNRTAFNDDGTSHNYTINEMNEYSQIDSTSRVYDDNGNLMDDGTLEYTWDFANRLVAAYDSTTQYLVESYSYDGRGRRITNDTVETSQSLIYVHDGDQVIETREASDNSLRSRFVYGISIDEPVEKETDGNKYYYHLNSLGSVVALTDANGAAYERYEYDAYGKPTIWDRTHTNTRTDSLCKNYIMYTGRWYDKTTTLYCYRARMYSPEEGRFLSHDPLGYMDSMVLFTYVSGNPINSIDPFGMLKLVVIPYDPGVKQEDFEWRAKSARNTYGTKDVDYLGEDKSISTLKDLASALNIKRNELEKEENIKSGRCCYDEIFIESHGRGSFQWIGTEGFGLRDNGELMGWTDYSWDTTGQERTKEVDTGVVNELFGLLSSLLCKNGTLTLGGCKIAAKGDTSYKMKVPTHSDGKRFLEVLAERLQRNVRASDSKTYFYSSDKIYWGGNEYTASPGGKARITTPKGVKTKVESDGTAVWELQPIGNTAVQEK